MIGMPSLGCCKRARVAALASHRRHPRTSSPAMAGMYVPGDSPSDTLNPHERPFAGMLDRHPRSASGRGGCSLSPLFLGGPPLPVLARVIVSGVLADDDRRRVVSAGVQGPAIRVIGEDDAIGAQPVDQHGPV